MLLYNFIIENVGLTVWTNLNTPLKPEKAVRVFFWEIAVKIPSQKTQTEKSNLRFPEKKTLVQTI